MKKNYFLIAALTILFSNCTVFKTAENISRLKYKIHSASDYQLAGIKIAEKKNAKDFSSIELLKLTSALLQEKMPLTFKLNIEAKNPNEGISGFERTDITIESFPWRLFVNDREVINGNIEKPQFIPGKGESTIIPLAVEFDLVKNYKEKNLDDILNLALKLGGKEGSSSNVKLKVKPTIGTPAGQIMYPDEITIVDRTFN